MKSKFAKFVDGTLGTALIFIAAYAALRYYAGRAAAGVSAAAITLAALTLARTRYVRAAESTRVKSAADAMFFEFMFMDERTTLALLRRGLKVKSIDAELIGNALYTKTAAVYCAFSQAAPERIARMVARAEKRGRAKAYILCKTPPLLPDIASFELEPICGEAVYRLFGALGVLPEPKHLPQKKKKRRFLAAALDRSRLKSYAILTAAMTALAALTHFPVVLTATAAVSALLFIACGIKAASPQGIDKME